MSSTSFPVVRITNHDVSAKNACCWSWFFSIFFHIFRNGCFISSFSVGECPLLGEHLGATHHWSICYRGVWSFKLQLCWGYSWAYRVMSSCFRVENSSSPGPNGRNARAFIPKKMAQKRTRWMRKVRQKRQRCFFWNKKGIRSQWFNLHQFTILQSGFIWDSHVLMSWCNSF